MNTSSQIEWKLWSRLTNDQQFELTESCELVDPAAGKEPLVVFVPRELIGHDAIPSDLLSALGKCYRSYMQLLMRDGRTARVWYDRLGIIL